MKMVRILPLTETTHTRIFFPGSESKVTDDENIGTSAGRGAGRGGRGGRGGAGRGSKGGKGRGNKGNPTNSPEVIPLPSLSAHAKSLRALRAVQATSLSRQLLEKNVIESEDDDLEWDEEILRLPPHAPPPGGVGTTSEDQLKEKIPPLARPPPSFPKRSVENDKKTSRGETDADFEENDLPDAKRMVSPLSLVTPDSE